MCECLLSLWSVIVITLHVIGEDAVFDFICISRRKIAVTVLHF